MLAAQYVCKIGSSREKLIIVATLLAASADQLGLRICIVRVDSNIMVYMSRRTNLAYANRGRNMTNQ